MQEGRQTAGETRTRRQRVYTFGETACSVMIAWLAATLYIKQVAMATVAAQKFGDILVGKPRAKELMREVKKAPFHALRLARIRIDCAVMLLWRSWCLRRGGVSGVLFLVHLGA